MLPRPLAASAFILLSACAAHPSTTAAVVERPLDTLPAGAETAFVKADLLATARARFGEAAVKRALSNPTHLIVKRFAGMVPPPPPGAAADWTPPSPAALLIRDGDRWMVASDGGWRLANAEQADQINALLADARLWAEPVYIPACPDFGSGNLLVKVPRRPETVRMAQCISLSASLVDAALRS